MAILTRSKESHSATASSNPKKRSVVAQIPPLIFVCLLTFTCMILAALLAPLIAPYNPNTQQLLSRNLPPVFIQGGTSEHFLGTDQLGRDVLSRVIYGLRVSIGIATVGTLVGLIIGTLIGLLSGFTGGLIDNFFMMMVDVQIAVPFILIALTAISVFGSSLAVLVLVIGFAGWETYARLSRGQVLAVKNLPFVEATVALGARRWRVAIRHVLPNIISPIIVLGTLNFSAIVLLESALSFLGMGVQPPTASLGSMVGSGRDYMASAWWIVAVPGFFVFLLTLVVSLIGDWLRDVLDARVGE